MAVILANCALGVRKRAHSFARDAHGSPVAPAQPSPVSALLPGSAIETGENNTWSLRVDPSLWPVYEGDEVTDGTRTWVVVTARLHSIVGYSDVDYVSVTGTLTPPRVP